MICVPQNLDPICGKVFGPWASPYRANGHMTMTVHTYRPRQFHRTSNGENPSSGYRDMGSASLAAARPATHSPARPPRLWRQKAYCNEWFLAATKQLYEWYFLFVRLSVTPFWLCSHHRIIMKFQELLPMTKVTSMQKVKVRGQRSRSDPT